MEPSDNTSTAMEEPDSLEVLVKTLDSQTRTFIVGAQVRQRIFEELIPRLCSRRDEPDFLVIDSFVPCWIEYLMFLLSEEVWLLLSGAEFVPTVFTLMGLSEAGK